jgi:hypothetical protein
MIRPKTDLTDVMEAVDVERDFQNKKWGNVTLNPHTPAGWMMLIESEMNEAKHALIKGGMGRDSWRAELIQVAALCCAALEQHGLEAEVGIGREL